MSEQPASARQAQDRRAVSIRPSPMNVSPVEEPVERGHWKSLSAIGTAPLFYGCIHRKDNSGSPDRLPPSATGYPVQKPLRAPIEDFLATSGDSAGSFATIGNGYWQASEARRRHKDDADFDPSFVIFHSLARVRCSRWSKEHFTVGSEMRRGKDRGGRSWEHSIRTTKKNLQMTGSRQERRSSRFHRG